jgi:hypothetical protein
VFTPLLTTVLVFAVILPGAFAGAMLRGRLPQHNLTEETKSLVSVSMAVVATISALVLGLPPSNANNSFNAVQGQVTSLSAEILRLDQLLRRYGADTKLAREKLQEYAERKRDDLFPNNPADVDLGDQSTYELLQEVEDLMLADKPANARDQWWLAQAMTLASKIGDTRFLLAQKTGQGTPRAALLLLVFWLTLLFASFTLFAPSNMFNGYPDSLRARNRRCYWNDSRIGVLLPGWPGIPAPEFKPATPSPTDPAAAGQSGNTKGTPERGTTTRMAPGTTGSGTTTSPRSMDRDNTSVPGQGVTKDDMAPKR